jgi:hypothetical protein
MQFVHTFSRWNAHVQMKAPTPSPMKDADNRGKDHSREALQRANSQKRLSARLTSNGNVRQPGTMKAGQQAVVTEAHDNILALAAPKRAARPTVSSGPAVEHRMVAGICRLEMIEPSPGGNIPGTTERLFWRGCVASCFEVGLHVFTIDQPRSLCSRIIERTP